MFLFLLLSIAIWWKWSVQFNSIEIRLCMKHFSMHLSIISILEKMWTQGSITRTRENHLKTHFQTMTFLLLKNEITKNRNTNWIHSFISLMPSKLCDIFRVWNAFQLRLACSFFSLSFSPKTASIYAIIKRINLISKCIDRIETSFKVSQSISVQMFSCLFFRFVSFYSISPLFVALLCTLWHWKEADSPAILTMHGW